MSAWHGWPPTLSGVNGASPWAASAAHSAGYLVESALGGYSSGLLAEWGPPVEFDAVEAASLLPDYPIMSGLMVALFLIG